MPNTEVYKKVLDLNKRTRESLERNNREIFEKYFERDSKKVLYIKDELIIKEDEQKDKLYLVDRGKVITTRKDASGKEYSTGYLLSGEFFGFSFIKDLPEVVNFKALTNCSIYEIEIFRVKQLLEREESLRDRFGDILLDTMRTSNIRNGNLIMGGCRTSFVNFILEHVGSLSDVDESGDVLVNLDVTLAETARILNMTRETLSRIVTQMKCEGIIDNRRRFIRIKDMQRFIFGV